MQKELVKEAERLEIKDKSTLVLTELLLTKDNILNDIKTYRMLFLRFCHKNHKAQKYLLGGYEKLVGDVYKDELFNNSMKILKQFYDEDILEEEVIIEWAKKASKKYVSKEMSKKIHEKVEPFIKWLKEAEVDSDEEKPTANAGGGSGSGNNEHDEDEDDEDDEEDNRSKRKDGIAAVPSANNTNNERKQSLEDDDDEDEDFLEFSHRVQGIQIVDASSTVTSKSANLVKQQQKTNGGNAEANGTGVEDEDLDIDNI